MARFSIDNLLNSLPTGAVIIDEELRILHWNRTVATWTGIPSDDAIGSCLADHYPNVRQPQYFRRLNQVFTSGLPASYSAAFHSHFLPTKPRHGLDLDSMVQQTEVRRISTNPPIAIISIQDVSFQYWQLKQIEAKHERLQASNHDLENANHQLRIRNTELDEFCYIAGHDLQDPLRKLAKFTTILFNEAREHLDGDALQALDFISIESGRMKNLVRDLMRLSRTASRELDLKPTSCGDCLTEAIHLVQMLADDSNAEITRDELPEVLGDSRLITQVFQNLISNAIKFVPKSRQPRIRISAERSDRMWILRVEDNGIGIEDDYISSIFKPFKQLQSKTKHDGTGIGLSICKKAVSRMGGEIWAQRRESQGAIFAFALPAACNSLVAGESDGSAPFESELESDAVSESSSQDCTLNVVTSEAGGV